jgi:hypothetical protein
MMRDQMLFYCSELMKLPIGSRPKAPEFRVTEGENLSLKLCGASPAWWGNVPKPSSS